MPPIWGSEAVACQLVIAEAQVALGPSLELTEPSRVAVAELAAPTLGEKRLRQTLPVHALAESIEYAMREGVNSIEN